MFDHIDDSDLKAFIQGKVSQEQTIKTKLHLSSCPECQSKYKLLSIGKELSREYKEEIKKTLDSHLDFEAIRKFCTFGILDEKLTLPIIDHLIFCKQCREKWADFEKELATQDHLIDSKYLKELFKKPKEHTEFFNDMRHYIQAMG